MGPEGQKCFMDDVILPPPTKKPFDRYGARGLANAPG
jgi:hypothetical protein